MKACAAALFVFVVCAFAQQAPFSPSGACGPFKVNFRTRTIAGQGPAQPQPGKALVYVAEDYPIIHAMLAGPTVKVGLDGKWMGATHSNSYVVFPADPGEHHLCIRWQSHLSVYSGLAAFAHFTAEAGKAYYFRARVYEGGLYLDLDTLDPDEGRYLVSSSQLSIAQPKK